MAIRSSRSYGEPETIFARKGFVSIGISDLPTVRV